MTQIFGKKWLFGLMAEWCQEDVENYLLLIYLIDKFLLYCFVFKMQEKPVRNEIIYSMYP